jgi:hypothetical protein
MTPGRAARLPIDGTYSGQYNTPPHLSYGQFSPL